MKIPLLVKKFLKLAFFLVFVLSVSFGIFEFLARMGLYEPNIKMYDYTILFDKERLFYIKANCAPDINEMGYRGSSFVEEENAHRKRILFLGDSFIMGHNVRPDATIAAGLGKSLQAGFEVFNMGVLAYGPDQSLVSLEQDGTGLNPDMVILGIFPANDFQDNIRSGMYSLDGGGRLFRNKENIVSKNVPRFRTCFLLNHLQFLVQPKIDPHHRVLSRNHEVLMHHLFADFYDTELLLKPGSEEAKNSIELMRSILARFQEVTRAIGSEFAVVIIPSYLNIVEESQFLELTENREHFEEVRNSEDGFFAPENITARLCDELEIPYLNLYPDFMGFDEEGRASLYDPSDWHLSEFGNHYAGELVAATLVAPRLSGSVVGLRASPRRPRVPWL